MKLVKVSDKENLELVHGPWDLEDIRKDYPDAKLLIRKSPQSVETKDILPLITIGVHHYLKILDPFREKINFIIVIHGHFKYCLNNYGYTPEDLFCQVYFGDRNIRPYDDKDRPLKFISIIKGYHWHITQGDAIREILDPNTEYGRYLRGLASNTIKSTLSKLWSDEDYRKRKSISGPNLHQRSRLYALKNKYPNAVFYLASMMDGTIKIGVTVRNIEYRYRSKYGNEYLDIFEVVRGDTCKIADLEYLIKSKYNDTHERYSLEELDNIVSIITKFSIDNDLLISSDISLIKEMLVQRLSKS